LPGISQIARRIELLDSQGPNAVDRRVPAWFQVNTLCQPLVKQDVEAPPLIESDFVRLVKIESDFKWLRRVVTALLQQHQLSKTLL
jgi:hypothetical protein